MPSTHAEASWGMPTRASYGSSPLSSRRVANHRSTVNTESGVKASAAAISTNRLSRKISQPPMELPPMNALTIGLFKPTTQPQSPVCPHCIWVARAIRNMPKTATVTTAVHHGTAEAVPPRRMKWVRTRYGSRGRPKEKRSGHCGAGVPEPQSDPPGRGHPGLLPPLGEHVDEILVVTTMPFCRRGVGRNEGGQE